MGAFIAIERALLGMPGMASCLFAVSCIAGGLDLGQGLPVPSPFGLLHSIVILAIRGML